MSLWWAQREQLDKYQLELIETLPLRESCLILGPPGSGKTNVLLRRAQFVRGQELPNVLVLSFTRSLTEFIKTGCFDAQGREIFPKTLVMTVESWLRSLYRQHKAPLPEPVGDNLTEWKRQLASGALGFRRRGYVPQFDTLFIDEAQDLLREEVEVFAQWSPVLFFVGDSRQKLFKQAEGLVAVRAIVSPSEHNLPFHYRMAPEICRMADRILAPEAGSTLEGTAHYEGPRPGRIYVNGPLTKDEQLARAAQKLKEQIRVFADLIRQGDRLGVVVALKQDRERAFRYFEDDPTLEGKSKIIRAREGNEADYEPSFDPDVPICILTVKGCKGLEFRAAHWLFSEELSRYHDNEHYYTVVTRAKTILDIYYSTALPQELAQAYSEKGGSIW